MTGGQPNGQFESRVGKEARLSGKLVFRRPVKIEGEAEGELSADEVMVAEGAVVNARITAGRVTVAGTVNGEINASERVELLNTARVKSTITTASLVLREGAQFEGDCRMPKPRAAA